METSTSPNISYDNYSPQHTFFNSSKRGESVELIEEIEKDMVNLKKLHRNSVELDGLNASVFDVEISSVLHNFLVDNTRSSENVREGLKHMVDQGMIDFDVEVDIPPEDEYEVIIRIKGFEIDEPVESDFKDLY